MWRVRVAGRYRLLEPLGRGGMGRVWLARDEMLRRDVAVKEVVLPEGLSPEEHEELRVRTLREARAAARLNHPNVVAIYDVVQTEDRPWIVMEYVRARSLHEVLRETGPLPPYRVATIGLALLSALRAAHSAGVLHRDVKPGNVLLADDGRVVLTDFGLALFETGEGAVTRPGLVLGSPQYVAPERARDGISSPETDLWSLGATLYAAVEGHAPYARTTAMATLTALATEAPRPAARAGPLKPVLDGLLRKNPRTRLDPAEAERLLRSVAAGGAVTPRPFRRRWLVAAAAAAGILVPSLVLVVPRLSAGPPDGGARVIPPAHSVAAAAGALDCGAATSTAPSPANGAPRRFSLLPNWRWYDDPAGYSLAVPDGWTYSRSGPLVCFRERGGPRILAIETLDGGDALGDGGPLGHWQGRERQLTDAGRLPRYTRVGFAAKDYFLRCVDWEFTYEAEGGGRLHAVARGFLAMPGRAYAIYWVAKDFDWQSNLDIWSMVAPSFTPPAS